MGLLKKIITINLSQAEIALEKQNKPKKRHKLFSHEEFMSEFEESNARIEKIRKSIQNK